MIRPTSVAFDRGLIGAEHAVTIEIKKDGPSGQAWLAVIKENVFDDVFEEQAGHRAWIGNQSDRIVRVNLTGKYETGNSRILIRIGRHEGVDRRVRVIGNQISASESNTTNRPLPLRLAL